METLSKIYLVMEYAGGGELYTYVHDNGKLTEEVAKPIFAQLVSAVAHLVYFLFQIKDSYTTPVMYDRKSANRNLNVSFCYLSKFGVLVC